MPTLREIVKAAILDAMQRHGGNQTAAASDLGLSYKTLRDHLQRYGWQKPARQPPAAPHKRELSPPISKRPMRLKHESKLLRQGTVVAQISEQFTGGPMTFDTLRARLKHVDRNDLYSTLVAMRHEGSVEDVDPS